jgi:hypothetical protein
MKEYKYSVLKDDQIFANEEGMPRGIPKLWRFVGREQLLVNQVIGDLCALPRPFISSPLES